MPLTLKPPKRLDNDPAASESASPPSLNIHVQGREQSPEAPPVSPLSPVLTAADQEANAFATQQNFAASMPEFFREPTAQSHSPGHTPQVSTAQFIDQPPTLPFSGEDSTDAIALRAAISSLQFQRGKAQQDLRTLDEIKRQAAARPEDFRQFLLQSVSKNATQKSSGARWTPPADDDGIASDEEDTVPGAEDEWQGNGTFHGPEFLPTEQALNSQRGSSVERLSPGLAVKTNHHPSVIHETKPYRFPPIPGAQEVVRCPPIEWAKYQILGEPLDKLHREQQLRPGIGGVQGRESAIAAAYSPFVDRLGSEERPTGDLDRKDSGASTLEQTVQRRRPSKAFMS